MRKNEPPHSLKVCIGLADKSLSGKCSCVAGVSGYCHHVIGLFYYLAHCKQLGLGSLPDDLTCTSMQQRWSIPRGKTIQQKEIQELLVKKPKIGADYNKFIESTLYSPSSQYDTLTKEHFSGIEPKPLMVSLVPRKDQANHLPLVPCRFGNVPKGSVLSYQQKLSQEYVINDFTCTTFPILPLDDAGNRFKNNVVISLDSKKQATLDSLQITLKTAVELQERTVTQSNSSLWHLLRKKRITASKFGLVARRVSNFENLVLQLNPTRHVTTAAMRRGIELEPRAAMVYANSAKGGRVNLFPSGLIINPNCPWLGCSPDRKVYDFQAALDGSNPFGLLEIKVVKEGETDLNNVRYLIFDPLVNEFRLKRNDVYFYQVQCQLGLTGLDWLDFFCYVSDSLFMCERILFDRDFFQEAKDKVDAFFFNYFLS